LILKSLFIFDSIFALFYLISDVNYKSRSWQAVWNILRLCCSWEFPTDV